MRHSTLVLLLMLAVLQELTAQESGADSTLFRRGQWAAQFGGLFTSASVGVLRFTTPRAAWVFDIRVSGGHSHFETTIATLTGDTTISGFQSNANVSLRAGRRVHRVAGRSILAFVGGGALAGFNHSADGSAGQGGETNGWSAGAFGEFGGTYLVNDHLGLGATADLTFTYTRSKSRSGPPSVRRTSWSYGASAPNLRFAVTIYF